MPNPPLALAQWCLEAQRADMFDKWLLYLWAGYNVLVHGVGSKRDLLRQFMDKKLGESGHVNDKCSALVEIDGFSSIVRHAAIVSTLLRDVIGVDVCDSGTAIGSSSSGGGSGSSGGGGGGGGGSSKSAGASASHASSSRRPTNHADKVDFIVRHFSTPLKSAKRPYRLFLVVHNLDGVLMRKSSMQATFSALAAAPRIHLVASVDHVKQRLLWSQRQLQQFNFKWQCVPTFEPYRQEALHDYGSVASGRGHHTLRGILYVLQSITANHRLLWRLVAQHQLRADEEASNGGTGSAVDGGAAGRASGRGVTTSRQAANVGIDFQDLVEQTRTHFVVRNWRTINRQLKELEDHRLLQQRVTADGVCVASITRKNGATVLNGVVRSHLRAWVGGWTCLVASASVVVKLPLVLT